MELTIKIDINRYLNDRAKNIHSKGEYEYDSYYMEELKSKIEELLLYSIQRYGLSDIVEESYNNVRDNMDMDAAEDDQ